VTTTSDEFEPALAELPWEYAALRLPRRIIMGTPIDLADRATWVYCIGRWLSDGTPGTAIGVNANLINLAKADPTLEAALNSAELSYADGQAVVWAAQALGWPVRERLATTDMVHPLCDLLVERGASLFLLGGEPGVADAAAKVLQATYPGLQIAGTCHGYLPREQDAEVVKQINDSHAQVLLVGMGDPAQQMWVARHRPELKANAVLTCGGLFNWINGKHPRPPQWMVTSGLEWVWRLALEPGRLWRRYVVGNPQFVSSLLRELLRGGRRRQALPQWSAATAPGNVAVPDKYPDELSSIPHQQTPQASKHEPSLHEEEAQWN
jgi:N-acetylglucosaminyldiphosphoundecaprenol N-acetyl-beta-D-mannosaminyltransferase